MQKHFYNYLSTKYYTLYLLSTITKKNHEECAFLPRGHRELVGAGFGFSVTPNRDNGLLRLDRDLTSASGDNNISFLVGLTKDCRVVSENSAEGLSKVELGVAVELVPGEDPTSVASPCDEGVFCNECSGSDGSFSGNGDGDCSCSFSEEKISLDESATIHSNHKDDPEIWCVYAY
ncbi:hypothetical protein AX774_g1918 [Zancudomyces culisetae]|uniref:Uncharacterized protein n=1 Tax=Zancudomyces culisetae TaxID=1213189 RepID=A0A1R1PUD1_ZANCU|nr:hypothetical protein AX774_g1918 [Zancudomyces culisetae]|eukprot:OMH84547.1 hypothetical protein AX774_g1918 [Zancudomyces culisetae]